MGKQFSSAFVVRKVWQKPSKEEYESSLKWSVLDQEELELKKWVVTKPWLIRLDLRKSTEVFQPRLHIVRFPPSPTYTMGKGTDKLYVSEKSYGDFWERSNFTRLPTFLADSLIDYPFWVVFVRRIFRQCWVECVSKSPERRELQTTALQLLRREFTTFQTSCLHGRRHDIRCRSDQPVAWKAWHESSYGETIEGQRSDQAELCAEWRYRCARWRWRAWRREGRDGRPSNIQGVYW